MRHRAFHRAHRRHRGHGHRPLNPTPEVLGELLLQLLEEPRGPERELARMRYRAALKAARWSALARHSLTALGAVLTGRVFRWLRGFAT